MSAAHHEDDAAGAVSQAHAIPVPELEAERGVTCRSDGPLGTVVRQLHIPYPRPNASAVISCDYAGASGLRRYERLSYQIFDDVYQDPEVRLSEDNGRTWTPWRPDSANQIGRGHAPGLRGRRSAPRGPEKAPPLLLLRHLAR